MVLWELEALGLHTERVSLDIHIAQLALVTPLSDDSLVKCVWQTECYKANMYRSVNTCVFPLCSLSPFPLPLFLPSWWDTCIQKYTQYNHVIVLDNFSVKCNLIFIPSKDENENAGKIKVAHLKVRSSTDMHAIHFMIFISQTNWFLYFGTILIMFEIFKT